MRTITRLQFLTALGFTAISLAFASPARAQAQEHPKPGPEQERLKIWAGKWAYHGAEQPTPIGIAGEFKGKSTNRMVANGFAVELQDVEKAGDWLSVMWFDSATRGYLSKTFHPSGSVTLATVTIDGNTWTSLGEMRDAQGKLWKTRNTVTFYDGGKSSHSRQEYSADEGKTWQLWWEARNRKTGK